MAEQSSESKEYSVEQQLKDVQALLLDFVKADDRKKGQANGADTAEYLRILRLMRTERHSYEEFANNFSSQAERILQKIDDRLEPAIDAIDKRGSEALAEIEKNRASVDGAKKLMVQANDDAQVTLAELKKLATEIKEAHEDFRVMKNATIKKWNENTRDISTANVEKYAAQAAKEAFDALSKDAIEVEVARQVRQLMKAQKK